ncbi:NAD-glutamate dehydrogenase [Psychrobacter sp. I-STPA10]|uniref:NAD-glutamate dehydrogenase n=1 Tax=Psychrobacter sp. I-STPA10 TaxID=2585769 RepID=UPI001E566F6E|nr:NAD-glutamate dehydrogenase [Psychrobacter sp. I-STPA10]
MSINHNNQQQQQQQQKKEQQQKLAHITEVMASYTHQKTPLLEQFSHVYYHNLTKQDMQRLSDEDLAGMALHHLRLLQRYDGKAPLISIFNPTPETHHFHTSHSVIQMVAYDRPFLVDTLLLSLEAQQIDVHRLFHTIVQVVRDDNGDVTAVQGADNSDARYISLIHCEIDRQQEAQLEPIRAPLLEKVALLDTLVKDWQAMQDKLKSIKAELSATHISNSPYSMQEVQTFLDWIMADHFVFLGYREYHLSQTDDELDLYSVGGSGLGLLRQGLEDKRSESFHQLPNSLKNLLTVPQVLLLSKSSHISPVHRAVYMDFLGIQKFDEHGKVIGEYRFIGLLTSRAYQLEVNQIPLLREKTAQLLARADLPKNGHAYHKLLHIINTLPRDDLFQGSIDELYPMVTGIANLQDRKRLYLFTRIDHYQRFVSCLVYIPRDKFNTQLRVRIQNILVEAFGGISSGFTTQFDESHHARVHVHVRTKPGHINSVNKQQLEQALGKVMQGWQEGFEKALFNELGEAKANQLLRQYSAHIPASYQEHFDERTAVLDIMRLDSLNEHQSLLWHLYQSTGNQSNQLNLKLYGRGTPAILSHILPILEKFGVEVVTAQTYDFGTPKTKATNEAESTATATALWMQEYTLILKGVDAVNMAVVRQQFEDSLEQIWNGWVESDYFNELILTTSLDTYDVVVLRALSRYMLQAKAPFSSRYIQQTLVKYSDIAVQLIALFDARMNLAYHTDSGSTDMTDSHAAQQRISVCQQQLLAALQDVSSLDEDRILRWYIDLINAMLRSNFYQRDDQGKRKDRLSFKFDAQKIPNLPKPKPMFEIFVYSPRVEAVHLRGGKVARGGLRWSDRMEDFRTEVLGLVKAQMVKNAVIVPVGSKGGFIVKNKTMADGREALQKEGIACYQTFLRGMLDITDNIVDGSIIAPADTVRHDGDDPYLVVAADKGTASFSDIANGIAAEYQFWLDDAFASGGSVGYDHKAMGITARGAWESVKRHFRMLGMDIQQKDDFTVVGIGDMSGDVFGNGMLLSKHIKLQAAFNHLHIFIDPNPDTQASFNERARLFEMPRSSWADYDTALISEGGGVFSRQDKSIAISAQMKAAFAINSDALTPNELIHALLQAPVDLIWNGGIGTYIKSSTETNNEVGDRANDAVRVNGEQVRARVIGEGGNLGCTQQGRIEYALSGGNDGSGGRIYTDAIDNSGGVNCSDHEVNIKILLGQVVEQGDMTTKQRNELLESMTDTVAQLVLRQNYLQPQTIELSAAQAVENLSDHQRFISYLEDEGRLDRAIEFLPTDDEIHARKKAGTGLTNPELAVVLAYGKMWVYDALLESDLPDDDYFVNELRKYFPDELVDKFFAQMVQHRLHREIISTYLTNSVVNRLGIESLFRLYEETGQPLATIVRAYAIARDVFNIRLAWQMLESLDEQVGQGDIAASIQLELENRIRDVLSRGAVWFINTFGSELNVTDMIVRFGESVNYLTHAQGFIAQQYADVLQEEAAVLIDNGLSLELAQAFVMLPYHVDALDTALLAQQYEYPVEQVAALYFDAYQSLQLDWISQHIAQLPQQDHWDRRARYALQNELNRVLRQFLTQLLNTDDAQSALQQWKDKHQAQLDDLTQEMQQMNSSEVHLSTLSVMMSEINRLLD